MPHRITASLRFCAMVGLIACFAASAPAQARKPKPSPPGASAPKTDTDAARRFVGTWTAEFTDTTFIRIEIKMADGKFSGSIATGNIHTAEDGRLTDVSAADKSQASPFLDVALDGNTMTFKRHDGDDVDQMQMTWAGNGAAELRFIFPPSQDAPKLQPIELTRRIER